MPDSDHSHTISDHEWFLEIRSFVLAALKFGFGNPHPLRKLPAMKILRLLGVLSAALGLAALTLAQGLPLETTTTQATKFEILRNGQPGGSVSLPKGAHLEVIGLEGTMVQVRYRSLTGQVPAAHTGLAALVVATPAPAATPASAPATKAQAPAPAAAPATAPAAPTVMSRRLAGKLVRLQGNALQPLESSRAQGLKFYALYFSASWCGPCRQFTPQLVDAYRELKAQYPEFEVVFVSADNSVGDMRDYMKDDRMAWPALKYDAIPTSGEIMQYCGDGIPCLVLVDEKGKVLSDTNRGGDYVGPQAVLQDTRTLLQRYRQKHPRQS
jgi:nucleoredoxin